VGLKAVYEGVSVDRVPENMGLDLIVKGPLKMIIINDEERRFISSLDLYNLRSILQCKINL
jgi:hypothetical protein